MTTAHHVHLDCDTGIDDALALAHLLSRSSVDLVSVSTVSGNTSSAQAATNTLDLLAIGPLTNLAHALELDPGLPSLVKRLTIMGGAVWVPGNITAHASTSAATESGAQRCTIRSHR